MATLMAGFKATDGKFYQKAVEWDKRGRPVEFKAGQKIEAGKSKVEVAEVTRYFIVSREMRDGEYKRIQAGSFSKLDDAQVEMLKVESIEKSRKLTKDFSRHVVQQPPMPAPLSVAGPTGTWKHLKEEYEEVCRQAIKKGTLKAGSLRKYNETIRYFTEFLAQKKISLLADIDSKLIENFKEARIDGGASQAHVTTSKRLNPVLELAVKRGWMSKNPLQYDSPRRREDAERGAQPYSYEERKALEAAIKTPFEKLAYWLLFRTGVRRGDAIRLRWKNINGHIEFVAQKNGRKVRLPILPDLKKILDAEREAAKGSFRASKGLGVAADNDYVLLNPTTKSPFATGDNFYEHIARLGKNAKVHAYPHRFRDTFGADCFLRGCDVSELAAYLGDTVKVVEDHYSDFINERKDRADAKMLAGVGLE